ncbi:DMT family transporter [Dactylosporangium roseum]|uniref:DMT family transporter n=1 Tax=Dactylosporangium roseum TaxID=47989 RepID=A0ABY5Z6R3_9ACTN|nr:DMT family transporter [Dactylosporangium roseum]UWZ37354.1 DMT family transporter [Dactylosporangium roseum]
MRQVGLPTIAALVVSIMAISSSAPLIVFAAAPALAIAFWRNAIAVAGLAPVALTRRRFEVRDLLRPGAGRRTLGISALSGLCLAVHFGTWVPSAKLTSVAMSVALVSTTPVWTALISAVRGIHVPRSAWAGIGLAVAGVAIATGADPDLSGRALLGDGLALAGGVAAAGYTIFGERARASIATTTYTTICYSICAVVLVATCLVTRADLVGYDPGTWLAIAGMTLGPQLLGHTLINYALRRVSATTVAVLLLLEVPGALLIAWLLLDQLPAARTLPGIGILLAGVAVVVLGTRWRKPGEPPPPSSPGQPTNGGTVISPEAIGTT